MKTRRISREVLTHLVEVGIAIGLVLHKPRAADAVQVLVTKAKVAEGLFLALAHVGITRCELVVHGSSDEEWKLLPSPAMGRPIVRVRQLSRSLGDFAIGLEQCNIL